MLMSIFHDSKILKILKTAFNIIAQNFINIRFNEAEVSSVQFYKMGSVV